MQGGSGVWRVSVVGARLVGRWWSIEERGNENSHPLCALSAGLLLHLLCRLCLLTVDLLLLFVQVCLRGVVGWCGCGAVGWDGMGGVDLWVFGVAPTRSCNSKGVAFKRVEVLHG